MKLLVPQGIGDIFWASLKAKNIAEKYGNGVVDLRIACWYKTDIESRALDFVKRFDFVHSAEMYAMPHAGNQGPVLLPGALCTPEGYYRYLPDGYTDQYKDIDYIAIPNYALERGISIKDWLPEVDIDYNILQDNFKFTDEEEEFGNNFRNRYGNYVVFFCSSLTSNTVEGHNRLGRFSTKEWLALGEYFTKLGLNVILIGAKWDFDYYEQELKPKIKAKRQWFNYIDQLPIFLTIQVIKNAKFLISYQSGLGIISNYLTSYYDMDGKPSSCRTAMWWRAYGDSISANMFTSFNEKMNYCWTKPGTVELGQYMPCIYGKHGVPEILDFIKKYNWL